MFAANEIKKSLYKSFECGEYLRCAEISAHFRHEEALLRRASSTFSLREKCGAGVVQKGVPQGTPLRVTGGDAYFLQKFLPRKKQKPYSTLSSFANDAMSFFVPTSSKMISYMMSAPICFASITSPLPKVR